MDDWYGIYDERFLPGAAKRVWVIIYGRQTVLVMVMGTARIYCFEGRDLRVVRGDRRQVCRRLLVVVDVWLFRV